MNIKILIFSLLVRLISLSVLIYSETNIKIIKKETTKYTYLKNINDFSNFWEIRLTKSINNISRIGYKIEYFNKENKIYKFKYKFIKPKNIPLPINPSIEGEIKLNNNYNINQLNIIISKKYLLKGFIETGNIIKLQLNEIGYNQPLISKIYKLDKLNLDLFLFYGLPYQNLNLNKQYEFEILDLNNINNEKINTKKIYITKKSENIYEINLGNGIITTLTFSGNKLIYQKNPFFISKLITNINKQKEIVNYIDHFNTNKTNNIKPENNFTINKISKSENKLSTKKNKINKNSNLGGTGLSTQKRNIIQSDNTNIINEIKNINITQTIKKLTQNQKIKYCPILLYDKNK